VLGGGIARALIKPVLRLCKDIDSSSVVQNIRSPDRFYDHVPGQLRRQLINESDPTQIIREMRDREYL
jgi:hypothetical protein